MNERLNDNSIPDPKSGKALSNEVLVIPVGVKNVKVRVIPPAEIPVIPVGVVMSEESTEGQIIVPLDMWLEVTR